MSPEAAVQPEILHLSLVVGGALRDGDGERLGRVDDLIVRLGGTGYPPITGFLVSVAGRQAYLPAETASALEGEEIIQAGGERDRELEADVFEELDEQHQLEFIEERSDADVAGVLARMAPDDAADLVAELPDERREGVLMLLPAAKRTKLRTLL